MNLGIPLSAHKNLYDFLVLSVSVEKNNNGKNSAERNVFSCVPFSLSLSPSSFLFLTLLLYGFCLQLNIFCVRNTALVSRRCCSNEGREGPWSIIFLYRSSVNDTHPFLSFGGSRISFLSSETVRKFSSLNPNFALPSARLSRVDPFVLSNN